MMDSTRGKSISVAPPVMTEEEASAVATLGVQKSEAAKPQALTEATGMGFCLNGAEVMVVGAAAGEMAPAIPPAVLAPRFAGEPVRADLTYPAQARGTGEPWPPEARIENGVMGGRFPLAYAWPMLEKRQTWEWSFEGRKMRVSPAEAIVKVMSAVGGLSHSSGEARERSAGPFEAAQSGRVALRHEPRCGGTRPLSSAALPVPNNISPAAQQELIDAAAALGFSLHLIPRPIAAAQAWCDHYAQELRSEGVRGEPDVPIGTLLVMHFGLDQWSVTPVDLLAHRSPTALRLIPVRRRDVTQPLVSYGLELLHWLAVRSLEMSYQQLSPTRVWELLWCTPWLPTVMRILADEPIEFPKAVTLARHARSGEFLKQQARQATQRIFRASEPVPALLRQCLGKTPQFTDLRDWYAARAKEAPKQGYLGAVITGEMANLPHERETIAAHFLGKTWLGKVQRVLTEGRELPRGVMAKSAAKFAAWVSQAEGSGRGLLHPPCLQPLPRVRIAGMAAGKPTWIDLFERHGTLVPTGVTVERGEPLSGFPIKPGTTQFKVVLHHEDWPTAQVATAPLPAPLLETEPVSLHVTLRPGHGFPRIELVPQRDGLFGRHRVLVDFRTCKDTGKTAEAFLKGV